MKEVNKVSDVSGDPTVVAWNKKNEYQWADSLFNGGLFYDAYQHFLKAKDHADAKDRAQACIQPTPATGELHHHESFHSSETEVLFEAGLSKEPHYIKVYNGDALVSTVFVNPESSVKISIPPGTYTIKTASGTSWFGDVGMFGEEGSYQVLLFDGGTESVALEYNKIYTITLVTDGGNVGDRGLKPENF